MIVNIRSFINKLAGGLVYEYTENDFVIDRKLQEVNNNGRSVNKWLL
jgi:hypothetical protein